MKKKTSFFAAILSASVMSYAALAHAESFNLGALEIQDPWARASSGRAHAGAAFMTILNKGETDRLLKAEANVSKAVELHTHIKDGDIMRMRQVEAIDITGGSKTELQPGGLHIMFIGLEKKLSEGSSFPLTLIFEKAGQVEIQVDVQKMTSMKHGMGKH